ncbi:MAG: mevalonate kinase [Lactobacillus sp.]|nr:mevalonate kinase [Lactobacillus sp.]MDN6043493.1 mevalonate kinase [Lactobacillus sp.]MDN6052277.1 mevalonate kinase [Lactobacillus sp.]
MQTSYRAHGKVIIIGEHAVVYGYNAIAIPIKALHITTTITPSVAKNWLGTARYHGPLAQAPSEYNGLKYVITTLLGRVNAPAPIKVTYTGEIPIERGLGSSATVALGTTKALSAYLKLKLTEADTMAITNHAEMINHGKASGLDAATVHADFPVFFNREAGPAEFKAKLGATLLIIDTGELGNTREAVALVKKQLTTHPKAPEQLARLGHLTDLTKIAWEGHDATEVGHYFNEAQAILAAFHLNTPLIDQLQQVASRYQPYGFKLSGGGLGGIVLCLCQNRMQAEEIATAVHPLIAHHWIEEI